jgi:hypothetical protein
LKQTLKEENNIRQTIKTMYEPSFVSRWYEAAAGTNQTLTIYHNLGEYPVKVDIQIKINENGSEYIFSGIGS